MSNAAAFPQTLGTKEFHWLNICMMADGSPLRVPMHRLIGIEPGRRLTVVSAQHGYETSEIEVCRQIVQTIDPTLLKGTLTVVPIASPITFEWGTRCTWIDSLYGDSGNMNRLWPGRQDGWITDRIIWELNENVVRGSDVVIDLHDGDTAPPGLTICYGYAGVTKDDALTKKNRELAVASGIDILVKKATFDRPGTLSGYCGSQGIACFTCEIGEFYGFQEGNSPSAEAPASGIPEGGVTAILNLMKHLGMLAGEPKLPRRQVIISPENNLRPSHGGLLISEIRGTQIGRIIPQGTLLGKVVSPYTFEVLEEIRAPYAQNMILATTYRHPFVRVNAGNYCYIVADMATAEWVNH